MVGDDRRDDDLNVDQHQTEGQHNLQWMDTLIGHTLCTVKLEVVATGNIQVLA